MKQKVGQHPHINVTDNDDMEQWDAVIILYEKPINIYANVEMVKAVSYTEDGLPSRLFNGMYRSSILADENDFTIDENGALTSYTGDLNDIIIPSHINGVEVTDIYKSTFDGPDMSVWGVTLPDTIKVLGAKPENARRRNSFMDNECILFIDGESVEELGAQVFMGCESLAFVNLPNVKKAGTSAFSRISTITKLYMPKLEIVGDSCFESSSFYQLILPELTTCSEYSFNMLRAVRMECPKLKSVEPFRWKIGECAFADAQVLHPYSQINLVAVDGSYFVVCCQTVGQLHIDLFHLALIDVSFKNN